MWIKTAVPLALGLLGGAAAATGTGMTTTATSLLPRDAAAAAPASAWRIPPRRLQGGSNDAYDMGGPLPICWRGIGGVFTRMAACPATVTLEFLSRPPNPMFAMEDYPTDYKFVLDSDAVFHTPVTAGASSPETWHIPHANIHSCFSTVGFCTPFIGNTPGLSTHTAALVSNMTHNAETGLDEVTFESKVRLDPGTYTIIAHIRWYTEEGGVSVRYDMATAMVRDVLPAQDILTVATPVEYAMAAVIGLSLLFLLINFAFLVRFRKHKIMRFSQANILMGMVAAGALALCGVPLSAINTQAACSSRPWITIIPLNFMFGLLFGKTWRIWKLMNNKQLKAIKITESWVVLVAFLLTLPEIMIHGLYFLLSNPQMRLVNTINEYTFIYQCSGDPFLKNLFDGLHLTYAACILILGCYVANKSASLTTLFNEGKYILFGIYTCSLMAVIIVPASFAVAGNPTTGYILRGMGISLAVAGTIGAINMPKIRLILSGVEISLEDNKTTNNRTSTTAAGSKTSGNAAGGASGAGGAGASKLVVKNHVPSAVMEKLQEALAAQTKVSDRQKQGFALVRHDFEQCVEQVRHLNDLLQRCAFAWAAPPVPSAPPGASAKVAPAST